MITFEFSGESHGKGYFGKLYGLPKNFEIDVDAVNYQLKMRKCGFGRSERQLNEDLIQLPCGNVTSPDGELCFFVPNARKETRSEITAVRGGHADVTGRARYPEKSVRQIAEIASARNSICYVVLGAVCKQILSERGIFTYHYVEKIGKIASRKKYVFGVTENEPHFALLHCPSTHATKLMAEKISAARAQGNSLGGVVAVGATGVPMGVGEILPYPARLDAQISANLVGIPSVKGITFGDAVRLAELDGASAADKLEACEGKIVYAENKCGGIVGGISTGQDILCHLYVKPVPTVKGVKTIDSVTLEPVFQQYERADTCVVPNVGVIAENILAYVILNALNKN